MTRGVSTQQGGTWIFWFRWQHRKQNNLLKHYLKQKFLTLCQGWYMLEQFSMKPWWQRCLAGGAAPRCPPRARHVPHPPWHKLLSLLPCVLIQSHAPTSPAPERQLQRNWVPPTPPAKELLSSCISQSGSRFSPEPPDTGKTSSSQVKNEFSMR